MYAVVCDFFMARMFEERTNVRVCIKIVKLEKPEQTLNMHWNAYSDKDVHDVTGSSNDSKSGMFIGNVLH